MKKIVKFIKNYWYYYKFYVIIGAVILAIAIFALTQVFSRTQYDYRVYLYLSEGITADVERAVGIAANAYGEDVDGNGSVSVQIVNLSYPASEVGSEYAIAQAAGLAGELQNASGYVFITDKYRLEELDKLGLFESPEFMDGNAQSLKSTDFESIVKAGITSAGQDAKRLPELFLSLRKAPPDNESNKTTVYQNGKALCENIIKNRPNSAD